MNRASRRARAKVERSQARRVAAASGAVVTLGSWLLVPSAPAVAATFEVTSSTDDGAGTTLREAIEAANLNPGADTVTFDPGVVGPIQLAAPGELVVTESITIDGPTGGITVVAAPASRVLMLDGSDVNPLTVDIDDLTITGGAPASGGGGGISADFAALTLTGVTVTGNTASSGGGVYSSADDGFPVVVQGASVISGNNATFVGGGVAIFREKYSSIDVLEGSTISGNTAASGGGGIYAYASGVEIIPDKYFGGGHTVTIAGGSSVDGNTTTTGNGGGILLPGGKYSLVEVLGGSSVSGNHAVGVNSANGGGINATGSKYSKVTVTDSTIADNDAISNGGGILVAGSLEVVTSTISGNDAGGDGGGVSVYGIPGPQTNVLVAAASVASGADSFIVDSTVSGNTANRGGGVSFYSPPGLSLELVNSSVSSFVAVVVGGGLAVSGSPANAAELSLRFTTVTGNTAGNDGGGLYTYYVDAIVDHTIFAGNNATAGTAQGDEAAAGDGSTSAPRFSLVQGGIDPDIDTSAATELGTNLIGVNPILGPLAPNGGPTLTHALFPGSPAIDAGDPAFAPPPATDQRGVGFPRPSGPKVDIGAFERQPGDPVPGGGGGGGGATVQFQAATASVNEDAGPAVVTITRTGDASQAVTVRVRSTNGSATSPADYGAIDQVVTFPPGVTTTTVPVPIVDDFSDEPDETFTLALSDPTGASIGSPSVETITIVDEIDVCAPGFVMPFGDVPAGNIHFESIRCIAFFGVTKGSNAAGTEYDPDGEVSRGQMASFIAHVLELHGVALPTNPPNAFDDDNGTEHELSINQLAALGIADGTGPRAFEPGASVSRAQMAGFFVRAYEKVTGADINGTANNFDDDNGLDLEPEINAGFENQLFLGRAPRAFEPTSPVHRDQMATFLMRLIDRLAEVGFPPDAP